MMIDKGYLSRVITNILFSTLQLEIKNHVFFSPINWDDLYHKRITPPFDPNVVSCCVLPRTDTSRYVCMNSTFFFILPFLPVQGFFPNSLLPILPPCQSCL